jgi:hypothetical protein
MDTDSVAMQCMHFWAEPTEAAEASKSTTPSKVDPPVEKVNKKRAATSEIVEGEPLPEAKAQAV